VRVTECLFFSSAGAVWRREDAAAGAPDGAATGADMLRHAATRGVGCHRLGARAHEHAGVSICTSKASKAPQTRRPRS
jgi:hypothetical protein